MKRVLCFLLSIILCMHLSGCANINSGAQVTATDPNIAETEIYQSLRANISDNATLPEALEGFAQMCQVSGDSRNNVYFLQVYTSDEDGLTYLYFILSRQFELPAYHEIIEVACTIKYLADEEIIGFKETTWEEDPAAFIEYVRGCQIYRTLLTKSAAECKVWYSLW